MADAYGPRATLRAARVFASPCRSASTQRNHGLRPDREPPRSSAAQFLTSVVVEVSLTGFIIPLTANPRAGLASHLEGVMNGTFLLALGCAWSELRLGALAGRFVHALLTFGAWANWAATLLSASAGDQQGNAAGRRRPRRDASAREPRLRSSRRWA